MHGSRARGPGRGWNPVRMEDQHEGSRRRVRMEEQGEYGRTEFHGRG
jgi:hypothetical protein